MPKAKLSFIRKLIFLPSVLMLLLTVFSVGAMALSIGENVPDFALPGLNGKTVALSDFKGQKVILNFWATWCPPCRQEMPEFNELNAELKQSGEAVLLAVNLTDGRRETKSKVTEFLKSNKYDLQVLLDTQSEVAAMFSIRGIPTTIVIDSEGVMRGQIVGATTKAAVLNIVRNVK